MIPGDHIRLGDQYYIRASSIAADLPKLVLKHDDAFFVADRRGDFPGLPESEFGFYVGDTRFLHVLDLLINQERPLLLTAALTDDAIQIAIDLTNPDMSDGDEIPRLGRSIHLGRRLTLYGSHFCQFLSIDPYTAEPSEIDVMFRFGSDFADVFDVRGFTRNRRGELRPPTIDRNAVRLSYRGCDDVVRTTRLVFDPTPDHLDQGVARYRLRLLPGRRFEISVVASALEGPVPPPPVLGFADVIARRARDRERGRQAETQIATSHEQLNLWIERSRTDLHMLATDTAYGRIPYAGIPWYVAPFGRDSLITAFQLLPFNPAVAQGTLRFLARHQGTKDDEFTDQEPGKILHEYRRGELAGCREIVFIPYYGSVDATPLFVMLLGEYARWSADVAFVRELWGAATRALDWLRRQLAGGYLCYRCRSERGLVNQGWKDSFDAIMHASGALAPPPIALVEAQGYAYAALLAGAEMAEALGEPRLAAELRTDARGLQHRFEESYWIEKEDFYALARDATGAPCQVVTSNPAHCLLTGLVSEERAKRVARRLMGSDMFSGWGLRTLDMGERRYNPMSYHNGSVWPHDTAIAAAGLRRCGLTDGFLTLATGLFEGALHWYGLRMPELFCGFARVPGCGPTRYPSACSPQAWSSGVVFHLLAGLLGFEADARENRLTLSEPVLPGWLRWIEVRGVRIGESSVDLRVTGGRHGAAVELLERRGDAEIVVRR